MGALEQVRKMLQSSSDPEKAAFLPKFFQAVPGGYGEGDRFIGVSVPAQRRIARKYYRAISPGELEELIRDPVHECRLTALFILILKFEKAAGEQEREELAGFYLENLPFVNNWDLVDSSAYKLLGAYLYDKDRDLLYQLARSGELWRQRVSIIATLYFIRNNDFSDTLKLAGILLNHEHDLIHKAVGWMLREVGNRSFKAEYAFLEENYRQMPRTALRYAIEKFEPELRKKFLKGQI
jgi:3-methyladenine DNA glycosylase AlkD